ncbi:sigma-70 family RNA polymerase sigma factor [Pseudomonadota bacterium]
MNMLSDPNTWPDQYGDTLYRHALFRLRDPMTAEEMVQETFMAALQARERFAGKSSEKTWLVGILKHKIIDYLRKAIREQPHNEEIRDFESLQNESFNGEGHWKIAVKQWALPEEQLESEHFLKVLNNCVQRLPQRLATLFIMREIDGLDSEAICKEMELSSTNNLWTMLSRMRMRLRQCLDLNWFGKNTNG